MSPEFGLSFELRNPPPWQRPFPDLYDEAAEQVRLAESLGYDQVWLAEHHFEPDGYCPSLMPVLAGWSRITHRIRVGTKALILPVHHPLRVAEDSAVVDIMSRGRLDVGVAAGYRRGEHAPFGVRREERGGRMEEALQILLDAWTQDEVSAEGSYYRFGPVSVQPRPVQEPHPPLWVGARAPAAIDRVARYGLNYLVSGGVQQLDEFREARRRHRLNPQGARVLYTLPCHVAESTELARTRAEPHLTYFSKSYERWLRTAGDLPQDRGESASAPSGIPTVIIGDPEAAVQQIVSVLSELPVDQLAFWMQLPGMAHGKVTDSMRLVASEVLPRVLKRLAS